MNPDTHPSGIIAIRDSLPGGTWLTGPDLRRVAWLNEVIEELPNSVIYAEIDLRQREALVHRIGPGHDD